MVQLTGPVLEPHDFNDEYGPRKYNLRAKGRLQIFSMAGLGNISGSLIASRFLRLP
jgi:hypothetical protein